jgi:hypothetical protein
MEMSAKMVVMSHLSNAQEEIGFMVGSSAIESINFAKYVIIETKGNLNQDIDADAMYSKFLERMKRHQISPKFSDPTAE